MTLEDNFKLLVSGYFGVCEMDEYKLKTYVLNDIEVYIRDYVKHFPLFNYNYKQTVEEIEKLSLKTKLQDSLLVLNMVKAPLELTLLIRNRLSEINNNLDKNNYGEY